MNTAVRVVQGERERKRERERDKRYGVNNHVAYRETNRQNPGELEIYNSAWISRQLQEWILLMSKI